MTDAKLYFDKFATIWGNRNQYSYFKGIKLSNAQKKVVDYEREQLLINGQAGTGKSLTLIYKMLNTMAKEAKPRRFLYITFNETLIKDTKSRLDKTEQFKALKDRHHLEIATYHQVVSQLAQTHGDNIKGAVNVTKHQIELNKSQLYMKVAGEIDKVVNSEEYKKSDVSRKLFKTHTEDFFVEEFQWMKANGILDFDTYMEVERTGRTSSIRLTREQRKTVYEIFEKYRERESSQAHPQYDLEDYALYMLGQFQSNMIHDDQLYDYIYVDEVQDFQAMQLKSLGMLYKRGIVMAGDPRQSVYKRTPLSYEKLGFDFKSPGAMRNLTNNYRSTYEIALLSSDLDFVDQNTRKMNPEKFKAHGEKPRIVKRKDERGLMKYLVDRIKEIRKSDKEASICVIVRDDKAFKNKQNVVASSPLVRELKMHFSKVCLESQYNQKNITPETVFVFDPYDIKGLEFDYVFMYEFNDHKYPYKEHLKKVQERCESDLQSVGKQPLDLIEFMDSEKKLLYVAMTRAKKELEFLVYGKTRVSRFASDFERGHFRTLNIAKKDVLWYQKNEN